MWNSTAAVCLTFFFFFFRLAAACTNICSSLVELIMQIPNLKQIGTVLVKPIVPINILARPRHPITQLLTSKNLDIVQRLQERLWLRLAKPIQTSGWKMWTAVIQFVERVRYVNQPSEISELDAPHSCGKRTFCHNNWHSGITILSRKGIFLDE